MEKYCNVIQVRWCVIVHNHKDSTGAERVMQVPLDTERGFLTSWNCWKCMVSDLTHDKTFTMMPELELFAVWMFVCLLSNEYLHKQHGWTVYYMVDLWLSRLTHQPSHAACHKYVPPWYVQFSSIFQTGQRMLKHTVISMCPCTYYFPLLRCQTSYGGPML